MGWAVGLGECTCCLTGLYRRSCLLFDGPGWEIFVDDLWLCIESLCITYE
jgi:hypothetical protein